MQKPPYWGGYRVVPDCFEFWQGQTTRIHDRLRSVIHVNRFRSWFHSDIQKIFRNSQGYVGRKFYKRRLRNLTTFGEQNFDTLRETTFPIHLLRFRRPESGEEINSKIANVGADGWIIERLSP